jgi:hypothetical protein
MYGVQAIEGLGPAWRTVETAGDRAKETWVARNGIHDNLLQVLNYPEWKFDFRFGWCMSLRGPSHAAA